MKPSFPGKHQKHQGPVLPTARKIRRTCNLELYRTIKKLNKWIPQDRVEQAEKFYVRKVAEHILWIHEHQSNRRKLADWWDEHVCAEIAELWEVEPDRLSRAFRDSFVK